jgi:hypothetical protein
VDAGSEDPEGAMTHILTIPAEDSGSVSMEHDRDHSDEVQALMKMIKKKVGRGDVEAMLTEFKSSLVTQLSELGK